MCFLRMCVKIFDIHYETPCIGTDDTFGLGTYYLIHNAYLSENITNQSINLDNKFS